MVANLGGTHKDDMGASHKIPEEKMFLAIFSYIEHLYGKIKPKKLFFMAVDGKSLKNVV
jgi:5'-3' exoribonuclease 1